MTSASPAPSLLVVDDEPDLCTLYELTLLREGYQVVTAPDLHTARTLLATQVFDCTLTDMRLPDGSGLELVREITQKHPSGKVIVITAYGSAENAVEALKSGAFDYLTKPVDLKQFRTAVATALQRNAPTAPKARDTDSQTPSQDALSLAGTQALARIVGHSAVLVAAKQRIQRVARSMAPVLVQGESGTGKELVARALHACSHRSTGPFVAVNCGAIPENLLEAEFFGVRKGAYTGASHDRSGYFQAAQGGTLFLDEIGDLPLLMQAKLLRAIQERKIRALGSTQEEAVDVRFVSATHRDLAQAVKDGLFRQDLFYRLNVIEVRIPPLRERREDLPELVQSLLHRLCHETGQPIPDISETALAQLQQHPLYGNVRELENLLHRGLALCNDGVLQVEDLFDPETTVDRPTPPIATQSTVSATSKNIRSQDAVAALARHLDETERQVLLNTLLECQNDPMQAATQLGITLRQLSFRLQRLGIQTPTPPRNHA